MKFINLSLILAIFICIFPGMSWPQENAGENSLNIPDKASVHAKPWAFGKSSDRNLPIWAKGKAGNSLIPGEKKMQKKIEEDISEEHKIKSSLGLGFQEESASWKVTPSQKDIHPDEMKVRENRHVLGAYADVEPVEDLNIRLGPELIIKDEMHGDESAYTNQPDSTWGLGMKFKYDF